jgi:peptidyl-prolyl cis-trans isomerase SurA
MSLLASAVARIAALILTVLSIAYPLPASAQNEQRIVILVNDDPISVYDIEQRARFLALTSEEARGGDAKKLAQEMLIEERLQLQEARKLGVPVDEAHVDEVVASMAKRNEMDTATLTKNLGQAGVNIKTLRDRVKAQVVWQDVVRRKFRNEVTIGDADVDRALSQDVGSEGSGGLQLQLVSLPLPANANDRTVAERVAMAETLRGRFQNCANIPDLAKSVNGATVRNLDNRRADSLAQPARLLVSHAKVGQMTPPAVTASAVELYALCGQRSSQAEPEKREMAQRKLMQEEYEIRAQRLLRDIRQDAFIEFR